MKTVSFLKRRKLGGFTLAESVISLGIGAAAIAGGLTLSQHEMRLVKSVRETNAASHALEERVEKLRLVNWKQMTDPQHLVQYYFPDKPASGMALPGISERVSVTAYPDPAACTPLIIEAKDGDSPRIVSSGGGFDGQRLARVNVRVSWLGKEGKKRTRELASVISNAGINMTSLPPMGSDSSQPAPAPPPTTPPPTGTTPTTPTTLPPEVTPTPTPAPAPEPTTGNGNGNGRGNVAGKPGKK